MPETFFGWVVYLLQQYGSVLLKGAVVTLLLAVVGTFIGCIIGLIVGVIQTIPLEDNDSKVKRTLVRCLQRLLDAYVEVFRGTPMIVQAMVVYYGALSLFDIDMSPLFAGFLVVSIPVQTWQKLCVAVLNLLTRDKRKQQLLSVWTISRLCVALFCRRLCATLCRSWATT